MIMQNPDSHHDFNDWIRLINPSFNLWLPSRQVDGNFGLLFTYNAEKHTVQMRQVACCNGRRRSAGCQLSDRCPRPNTDDRLMANDDYLAGTARTDGSIQSFASVWCQGRSRTSYELMATVCRPACKHRRRLSDCYADMRRKA